MSLADRVCKRGGGMGKVKSGLPLPSGDGGGAIAAMSCTGRSCLDPEDGERLDCKGYYQ